MNIFPDFEPDDNRRPDILIRNPYGGGKQIIIDVAVTGIDGTTALPEPMTIKLINLSSHEVNRKNESTKEQLSLTVLTSLRLLFLMPAKWTWLSNMFSSNKLD
jgi:hypothetical protein